MDNEKIRERAERCDPNGFSFEIFRFLDVGPHHERLNDPGHRVGQDHHVGARQHRTHNRRSSDRRDLHAACDESPGSYAGALHNDDIRVETVLFKELRLLSEKNNHIAMLTAGTPTWIFFSPLLWA